MYSYEIKGDHFTIYKGKKKAHTPNGNVLMAYDEAMAKSIVALLESEADYTSPATMLCYHYTYCDLVAQYERMQIAADVKACVEDNAELDSLLMFGQDGKEAEQVMKQLIADVSVHAKSCSIPQLTAMIVLYVSFDSFTLSWRIINDIINPTAEGKDYATLKSDFMTDLQQYCDEEELSLPRDFSEVIDAFAEYYQQ